MSELTHEKTATTVEIATMKAERTTTLPSTTGRTPWDAVVDIGGMLGRYTPWIVIVAGACYGVFKFTTLTQDAQKGANERLSATYKEIGEMHDQQMRNLSAMMKLNGETAEAAERQRSRLNELQAATVKLQDEASSKIKAAEQAETIRDQATKEAEKAAQDLANVRIDLARKQQESEDTTRRITEQQGQFNATQNDQEQAKADIHRQTERIIELKGKLIDLANRLELSKDAALASHGRKILAEDASEAETLLKAYAQEPGKTTATPLEHLIGSNEKTLASMLPGGLGFTFWQKYGDADGNQGAYIGVVRQTANSADGMVLVSIQEKQISKVDVFPHSVSVSGRDPNDWDQPLAYNVYLRPSGEAGVDAFTPKTGQWKVPETETDFPNSVKGIYGKEAPMQFLSREDFKKDESDIFLAAKRTDLHRFSTMLAMQENEQNFAASKIIEPFAQKMPPGMSETFTRLLSESIQRVPVKTVKLAPATKLPPGIYGQIAAIALKNDFKIHEVKSSAAPASGKGETCSLICTYAIYGEPALYARLLFVSEASAGKWLLLEFEDLVEPPEAK